MALPRVADRALETTGVIGTGPAILLGAVAGRRTLNAAVGTGVQLYYEIEDETTGDWEIGEGHLSGATTLVRDRVVSSSNADALVSFAAGTKRVFVAAPAETIVPDKNYVHTQSVAASVWTVTHNLGKYPSVAVVDSGGNWVEGDVAYLSANTLTVSFRAPFGGAAYLN